MGHIEHTQKPQRTPLKTGTKIAEVRANIRKVYVAVVLATIPMTALLAALVGRRGHDAVWSLPEILLGLALFVPLGVVHELLHATAALVYGRVRPQDLRLAVHWKAGTLICHIKVPIRVAAARIVGLAPLAVTGPAMLALFLWHPSHVTVMLVIFAILGSAMDVVMVYYVWRFDDDLLIVDHPSEPGFDIYTAADDAVDKGSQHE
ncbi:MAG: DUF3267 domain-containing protein [Solirubrobacterales bacterium]